MGAGTIVLVVPTAGEVVEGDRPVNRAAFAIHSQVHAALPDVVAAAHALGESKAVILRNHGLLTVGRTVDEAAYWFISMERTCQAQLLAQSAGDPISIDHEMATVTAGQVGGHAAGQFGFAPLWDWITAEEPDLLD